MPVFFIFSLKKLDKLNILRHDLRSHNNFVLFSFTIGKIMRIVAQRVNKAHVSVDGRITGAIEKGLVLLIGIKNGDTSADVKFFAEKCLHLRIFEDAEGKMNRSIIDAKGSILAVSQFTLYADTTKGRRPNFLEAARPELAEPLYNEFVTHLRSHNIHVETGIFGAMMEVEIHNSGPVTIILE